MLTQIIQKEEVTFGVTSVGGFEEECTIERVALLINIIPCRELNLSGWS